MERKDGAMARTLGKFVKVRMTLGPKVRISYISKGDTHTTGKKVSMIVRSEDAFMSVRAFNDFRFEQSRVGEDIVT